MNDVISILLPDSAHPAAEERYGFAQSALLFSRQLPGSPVVRYGPDQPASAIVKGVESGLVLVVTDPLALPAPGCATALFAAISVGTASFSVPVSDVSPNPVQVSPPSEVYLTLGQLERADNSRRDAETVSWKFGDPGVFTCRTEALAGIESPLSNALIDATVSVVHQARIHRFATHRGHAREDLLVRIPHTAKLILDLGCGEGLLGAALKQRQDCRITGIEIDEQTASIAQQRLDVVHVGDVRAIIDSLDETFDWIVGGDILEHLDDPWSFLSLLKRVAAPEGRLLLSVPNIAHASIVGDLLRGRFDYVFLGILCAGHVRFFTRQTIRDLLDISGWREVSIEPQEEVSTAADRKLVEALQNAAIPFSQEDLGAPGYYVVAESGGN